MGQLLEKALKVTQTQSVTPANRGMLQDVMIERCKTAVAEVIELGRWRDSDKTRHLEQIVQKEYKSVLAGQGQLIDFHEAVEKWKAEGIR